jgi:metallophosphoesterase (TIGR00282 family)
MRILFLGDVVGKPGLSLIRTALPQLRKDREIDCVIANAENVSGGSGCQPAAYRQLREAGVDLVTLGDHVYKKAEIIGLLRDDERICRPANMQPQAPGHTFAIATLANGVTVAAVCALGRTFMRPANCPFMACDAVLDSIKDRAKIVVIDAHAEATADKYLLIHHLKGRVTAVLGTHTHVPTADEQLFPEGTAFQCDVGMCGPHDSILGRSVNNVLQHAVTAIPVPFDVADGDVRLNGAIIDCDIDTGKATKIERFMYREGGTGR